MQDSVTAKYRSYSTAAQWLNENVPAGSSIGTNEIGVLRFYYRRGPVIDGLGLVTPGVAEHVARKEYDWYVHAYRPDYLLFNHPHRPVLEAMVEAAWFQDTYSLLSTIETKSKTMAIYQRGTTQ